MLALWAAIAWGWELGPAEVVPVGGGLGVAAGGGELFVAVGAEVRRLGLDGASEVVAAVDAEAVVLRDDDADGDLDVLVCGDSGLVRIAALSGGWGAPTVVDPLACTTLVAHALAGVPGVAVAADDVRIWSDDGFGGYDGPVPGGVLLSGPARLAAGGERLCAAGIGDGRAWEIGAGASSPVLAGGVVGGIAASDGGWWIALSDVGVLRDTAASSLFLEPGLGDLTTADIDGDGVPDVVARYPGLPWLDVVTAGGAVRRVEVVVPPAAVVASDLDGDGCDDLVLLDEDGANARVLRVSSCRDDLDGDGATVEDGDCDDADPAVGPYAPEACDGRDTDCDGLVDELDGLDILGPELAAEGDVLLLDANPVGCADGLVLAWELPDVDFAVCSPLDAEVQCDTWEDGELVLAAALVDDGGVEWALDVFAVRIENVPPVLTVTDDPAADDFADGVLHLEIGSSHVGQLSAFDPGRDALEFGSEGGPSSFSVSSSGRIAYTARSGDVGRWDVTLTVSDGDGGYDARVATLLVADEDGDTAFEWGDTGWPETDRQPCEPIDFGGCFCVLPPVILLLGARRRLL